MRFPEQDTPQAAHLKAVLAFPLRTDCLEQMTLPQIFVSELRGRAGDLVSAGSLAGA